LNVEKQKMKKETLKYIFTLLIIGSTFTMQAQNQNLADFECKNVILDSIKFENQIIKYKILNKHKLYSKGLTDYFNTDIIFPGFDSNSDKIIVQKIINEIAKNNPTDEFNAFKNCETREIFYQGLELSSKQKKLFKKNFIGFFPVRNKN
jgi:hypothetical protein